jgi:hypothetical protein
MTAAIPVETAEVDELLLAEEDPLLVVEELPLVVEEEPLVVELAKGTVDEAEEEVEVVVLVEVELEPEVALAEVEAGPVEEDPPVADPVEVAERKEFIFKETPAPLHKL